VGDVHGKGCWTKQTVLGGGEGRRNKGGELMEDVVPSAALCTSGRTALDPALTDEHSLALSV
jgi:hypothetical protein